MYKKTRKRTDGSTYTVWAQDVVQDNKHKTYTARTKKELAEKLANLKPKTCLTLLEAITSYKQDVLTHTLQASTLANVSQCIKAITKYHGLLISDIDYSKAIEIVNTNETTVEIRKQILRLCRGAFEHLVRLGTLKENIFSRVTVLEKVKKVKKEIRIYSDEEISRILKFAAGSKYYLAILIAVSTGMRKSEILALNWEDIDIANKSISVTKTLQKTEDRKIIVADTKTMRSNRVIPAPNELIEELSYYKGTGPIFTNYYGKYPDTVSVNACLKHICAKAGVECKGFHAFRHTFATRLASNGADAVVISNLLGHESIAVTYKFYIAEDNKRMREAIELLPIYSQT